MRARSQGLVGLVGLFGLAAACGDRPDAYDTAITRVAALGMDDRVALIDDGAHRVVFLAPRAGLLLDRASVVVGKRIVRAEVSPDGKRLLVLSAGDVPRKKADDEGPSLTIVDAGGARRIPLDAPRSGISIDPLGRYAALFKAPVVSTGQAGQTGQTTTSTGAPSTASIERSVQLTPASQVGFVENPNQIEIVDLQAPPETAIATRTLRSFGGSPQRVTFTPPLGLPGGPRRLLVVQTQQDVTLLDLDNVRDVPPRPEITVRPTSGATAAVLTPEAVVADDGDPARSDDARLAVRFAGSPSVLVLTLVPTPEGAKPEDGAKLNDFTTSPNLTDVGGPAGDIAFVRTEAGLRLAAVVPSTQSAVLVDPTTSTTTKISMPGSYARLSLITNVIGGAQATDTALLYGSTTPGVAFWSLGRSTGQPYRSVEAVTVPAAVDEVLDVPPPREALKVLRAQGGANQFFVLNLATRTVSPLTTTGSPALHVAGDGQRLWAFQRASSELAEVALENLRPLSFTLERRIDAAFDVKADGGRALVAVDTRGAGAVTLLDALLPDTATSRSYYGLLFEDLR
jgi:hypothetical protein